MANNSNDGVVFKVEVDDSGVASGIQHAVNTINTATHSAANSVSALSSTVNHAQTEVQSLSTAVNNAAGGTQELGTAAQTAATGTASLSGAAGEAAHSAGELAHTAEVASHNTSDLGNSAQNSAKKTEELKNSVDKVKTSVTDAGKVIGTYATAAAAAFTAVGTAAAKSAMDAEASFAKVKTLLSGGTDLNSYYSDIVKASADTGVGFSDMSEAVYSAISASVSQESAVSFTQNAVKLAKGGFTQTATAVDVLTTAINAYGLAAEDASHISDVLITTQNLGKTTVDELAHSMGQTIPIANSAGVAIEELSTAYAVMTKNGVATAEAGTQIKAMFNELNASGTNVDKTLREITGKSFSELKAQGQTTADVLNTLDSYAEQSGKKLSDLFGSVEAGAAALTLVKDGGQDFTSILSQMSDSAGAAQTAFDTVTDTAQAKIEKLTNKIKLMFIEAGEDLLPLIDEFTGYINDNSDKIKQIIKDTVTVIKDVTVEFTKIIKVLWENKEAVTAVVAGYIAFKTAMAIGNVITSVVGAVKSLTTALQAGATAQEALNAAMNLNPYVLAASAIAAVTVGVISYANSARNASVDVKKLSDEVSTLGSNAKAAVSEQKELSDIVREYENISDSVSDASEKKERLAELQERLNGLYDSEKTGIDLVNGSYEEQIGLLGKLNEAEKARRINEVRTGLDEAYSKREESVGRGFDISFKSNSIDDKINEWYRKYFDATGEKHLVSSFINGDETTVKLSGDIDETISMLEDLEQTILDTREATGKYADQFDHVHDRLSELKTIKSNIESLEEQYDILTGTVATDSKSVEENTDVIKNNSNTLFDAANAANSNTQEISKQTAAFDELTDGIKSVISQFDSMTDAISKVKNGEALSYEQVQNLIKINPELADKISITADGYIVEADAIETLNNALVESANIQIEAENEKTRAAIEGARARIALYSREAATMYQAGNKEGGDAVVRKINEEYDTIDELEAKLKANSLIVPQLSAKATAEKSGGSSGSVSSGSSKDLNEEKFDEEYATLKYRRDMGGITDSEYYSSLGSLRDKYLTTDSTKWRSANVEIHKWEEQQKTGTKKSTSGSSSGTVISIDSYIPTVWDDAQTANKKLQSALGLKLAGNDTKTANVITDAMETASGATKSSVSAAAVKNVKAQTTLADVVSAISKLEKADENKKVSLTVDLYARDLAIGRVAVADINDITKMNGKSPLITP